MIKQKMKEELVFVSSWWKWMDIIPCMVFEDILGESNWDELMLMSILRLVCEIWRNNSIVWLKFIVIKSEEFTYIPQGNILGSKKRQGK